MKQTSVLAVMFVAMTVLLVMVVFSVENQPHAFKECLSCHVVSNPSGAGARQMTGPVTPLCSKCHEKTLSEGYIHPVDIRPEHVIIPADMPLSLSPAGELMCGTCHDIHSDYFTPYGTPTSIPQTTGTGKSILQDLPCQCKFIEPGAYGITGRGAFSVSVHRDRFEPRAGPHVQELCFLPRRVIRRIGDHPGRHVDTWKELYEP